MVAPALPLSSTLLGHVTLRLGAVASTCVPSELAGELLPARSLSVALSLKDPLVECVTGAGIDFGSTPLPALPSARFGSPLSVVVTVTESLYQPPPPA